MKRIILPLLIFSFSSSFAQDKVRELGLTTSSFNLTNLPLDFVYKTGHDNKFWRYEFGSITFNQSYPVKRLDTIKVTNQEVSSTYGASFRIAREYRKKVTDRFTFYHGPTLGLSGSVWRYLKEDFNQSNNFHNKSYRNRYTARPSIGYSIGGIFTLRDNLYMSAQLSPYIFQTIEYYEQIDRDIINGKNTRDEKTLSTSTNVSLNQSFVTVGLFYTFKKRNSTSPEKISE